MSLGHSVQILFLAWLMNSFLYNDNGNSDRTWIFYFRVILWCNHPVQSSSLRFFVCPAPIELKSDRRLCRSKYCHILFESLIVDFTFTNDRPLGRSWNPCLHCCMNIDLCGGKSTVMNASFLTAVQGFFYYIWAHFQSSYLLSIGHYNNWCIFMKKSALLSLRNVVVAWHQTPSFIQCEPTLVTSLLYIICKKKEVRMGIASSFLC